MLMIAVMNFERANLLFNASGNPLKVGVYFLTKTNSRAGLVFVPLAQSSQLIVSSYLPKYASVTQNDYFIEVLFWSTLTISLALSPGSGPRLGSSALWYIDYPKRVRAVKAAVIN